MPNVPDAVCLSKDISDTPVERQSLLAASPGSFELPAIQRYVPEAFNADSFSNHVLQVLI
jgi:hypothetical protein